MVRQSPTGSARSAKATETGCFLNSSTTSAAKSSDLSKMTAAAAASFPAKRSNRRPILFSKGFSNTGKAVRSTWPGRPRNTTVRLPSVLAPPPMRPTATGGGRVAKTLVHPSPASAPEAEGAAWKPTTSPRAFLAGLVPPTLSFQSFGATPLPDAPKGPC